VDALPVAQPTTAKKATDMLHSRKEDCQYVVSTAKVNSSYKSTDIQLSLNSDAASYSYCTNTNAKQNYVQTIVCTMAK